MKYTFEVEQTGRYHLDALYSTDDDTPVQVQVNGTTVADKALGESTGGWDLDHQRWQTLAAFDMREGLNFVRLNVKEGDFPRLDRLRLRTLDPRFDETVKQVASAQNLDALLLSNYVIDPAQPLPTVAGIISFLDSSQQKTVADFSAEMSRLAENIKPHELAIAVSDQSAPTDLPVHVAEDPLSAVAEGTGRCLSEPKFLHQVAIPDPTLATKTAGVDRHRGRRDDIIVYGASSNRVSAER